MFKFPEEELEEYVTVAMQPPPDTSSNDNKFKEDTKAGAAPEADAKQVEQAYSTLLSAATAPTKSQEKEGPEASNEGPALSSGGG